MAFSSNSNGSSPPWRDAEWFAAVPRRVEFCFTLAGAFCVLTLVLATQGWGLQLPHLLSDASALLLDRITYLVQIALGIYLAYLLHEYATQYVEPPHTSLQRARRILVALVSIGSLIGLLVAIEYGLLKPMFAMDRPRSLPSVFGSYLDPFFQWARAGGTSAPSGSALRSMVMALAIVLFVEQPDWHRRNALTERATGYAAAIVGVVLVTAGRLLSGRHYMFDLGVGIALGAFLFWWLIVLGSVLLHVRRDRIPDYIRDFQAAALFFAMILFLLSEDLRRWGVFCLGVLVVVAFPYYREDSPVSRDQEADATERIHNR